MLYCLLHMLFNEIDLFFAPVRNRNICGATLNKTKIAQSVNASTANSDKLHAS